MKTTWRSVIAKSWIIVGPGTSITSLCTSRPVASAR
jgi:hypothetical protein